jgi:hypothetical protein
MTKCLYMECFPQKSGAITPTNIAFLLMILDVIFVVLFFSFTMEVETFIGLAFFMSTSYWGSFLIFLLFHFIWITNFGPGSYWPNGPTYQTMFETYLAPFYLTQSGLFAPTIGLYYLYNNVDIILTCWVAIFASIITPILSITLLESFVCRKTLKNEIQCV